MKTLLRLAKKSAKNIQKKLLQNGKPFCKVLNTKISVTKLFLNHITYTKRDLSQPPMVHHAQGVQVP